MHLQVRSVPAPSKGWLGFLDIDLGFRVLGFRAIAFGYEIELGVYGLEQRVSDIRLT